jgi:hypothetical protein
MKKDFLFCSCVINFQTLFQIQVHNDIKQFKKLHFSHFAFILLLFFVSCQTETKIAETVENPFSGPSPWPEIRKERIQNCYLKQ